MYALKIDNYSSKELKKIFTKHIDKRERVTTDLWKGYRPLFKNHEITQIESNSGINLKVRHTKYIK